jgi:hypothetical protein
LFLPARTKRWFHFPIGGRFSTASLRLMLNVVAEPST